MAAAANPPLLLQTPSLSKTQIAFAYGDEIWIVPRAGGDAHVLVGGNDLASGPVFSPDGRMIAYTGDYDGNPDVYVVPATGGEPHRLTWYPGPDVAVGWAPDGKRVLFHSHRDSINDSNQLFTVPVSGGLPAPLPLSMAEYGSYSPGASRIAYSPVFQWEPDWKGYRGGQTTPIWIARLSDSSVVKIPRDNSNDRNPMWVGNTVYFLSDRDGPVTLFAYDTKTGSVTKLLNNDGFDIDSASAGPGAIVYSQMGALYLFNLTTRRATPITLRVAGDLPQLRPHFVKVSKDVVHAGISPTACARCSKPTATSSRCRRTRAISAISPPPPGPPSATQPGRRTASQWRILPVPHGIQTRRDKPAINSNCRPRATAPGLRPDGRGLPSALLRYFPFHRREAVPQNPTLVFWQTQACRAQYPRLRRPFSPGCHIQT